VQALVHPDDRTRLAEADRLWLAGREANTFEYRILLPSGECRHLITEREAIHDEKGGLVALFGAVRDVTVAKAAELRQSELESRLQHAQRLEALGTLAGGIAHDLNNTMVPVVVLAKLLTKHFMPGSREHANLQTIQAAGAHARELMQQVMSFSRIHAPSKLAIDLVELLREMRPMLGMLVPSTICIDEAIAAVPPVSVDPTQLRQVVVNLVVNAVQAIGTETGTITIALAAEANAPAREYENAPAAPRIHLSVRDTGCGMDEATMLRVFEPFFTTKKVGEGTGLGLSIAHGVVTEHGGHLAVESRIGVGTCFSVYLPARSAHDAARESGAADAAA
jgi:signal transduction histidine kinase